ncbi:unnamed protein product [Lampetra planeri]
MGHTSVLGLHGWVAHELHCHNGLPQLVSILSTPTAKAVAPQILFHRPSSGHDLSERPTLACRRRRERSPIRSARAAVVVIRLAPTVRVSAGRVARREGQDRTSSACQSKRAGERAGERAGGVSRRPRQTPRLVVVRHRGSRQRTKQKQTAYSPARFGLPRRGGDTGGESAARN